MRHILINSVQQKQSKKRYVNLQTLDDNSGGSSDSDAQWMIQLDKILQSLESSNPRLADVFQLKYFLGFTEVETSEILQVTDRTVRRDWIVVKKIIKDMMD